MIKYQMQQGSDEWLAARAGVCTASELDSLVTPLFEQRKGEMPATYLSRKLAERWLGHPLESTFSGGSMEQGQLKEKEAIPYYEFRFETKIEQVGFITTDDGRFGCSPDGLMFDPPETGIEAKCPEPHTHMKWLLSRELPKDHAAQVHGSMAVTGAREWVFMSYCRNLPPLIITVLRDNSICERIVAAANDFNIKLDAAYKRICEINGGEPDWKRIKNMETK